MAEKSIFDARLAEIDRRLSTIQSGLAPAAQGVAGAAVDTDGRAVPATEPRAVPEIEPRDAAPVIPPEAAPIPKRLADASAGSEAAGLVAQLRALLEAHERLLASAGDVLTGRAAVVPEPTVGMSAGPFAGTDALRRFERSLQALPEVRAVSVREYEGTDRVIIDVHLAQPTP
jgi:hypothetical protein